MGIRYLDEASTATAAPTAAIPTRRIRYLDEPQAEPRSAMNPYGLPRWQDRPLTSKLLPPFSPIQLAFTPGAERFGKRMVEGAQTVGRIPGNIAEALIGRAQPRVNPPGTYPRVQMPSEGEMGARSFIPSALDALIGAPAEVATSLVTPHSLGVMAAGGPAFETATASRFATTPMKQLPRLLTGRAPTVEQTFTKAIRPSVAGKGTFSQAQKYQGHAQQAVKTIVDFRSELALPDETGQLVPRLPESLKDFSQAIEQTKFNIFKRYNALAEQTGQQGVRITTQDAADAAQGVLRNPIIRRYYPEIARYADDWATRLREAVSHSPEEIQDLVAKMNADLEAYYRNPQPGSAARAVIDAGIANNLRKSLDTSIESATGGQYQLLKRLYGSLKTIEKDVNRRSVGFARQSQKGLLDFSDIFSSSQMVRGITSMNPSIFASGFAAKLTANYYKYINNPDRMVRQMFRTAAERPVVSREPVGLITQTARKVAPALREVAERFPKGERGSVDLSPRVESSNAPTFFSTAERLIQDRMPNAAPAGQVQGILRSGGVKQDEFNWLDIDSFLKDKPRATKQDVLQYIKDNNVQVQEVVKKKGVPSAKGVIERLPSGFRVDYPGLQSKLYTTLEEAQTRLAETRQRLETNQTKFSQYQLPGGTNYRELLLTVPDRQAETVRTRFSEIDRRLNEIASLPASEHAARKVELTAEHDVLRRERGRLHAELTQAEVPEFRSSHFDEPNVLAHVRFNDRVDAQGKKVLFIEEVQSDWHQKGRKEGYQAPQPNLTDEQFRAQHFRPSAIIESYGGRDRVIAYHPQTETQSWSVDVQAVNAYGEPLRGERVRNHATMPDRPRPSGVPDAPFKKTWHELALKRMIRWAAEHKYDKLAWTTGEQQAARYDLSKQIDEIRYIPRGDTWDITAVKDGAPVISKPRQNLQQVEELVGKDIAQKIKDGVGTQPYNRGYGELKGVDLKVGGEGMKGFYDKILPDFLNRYAKKWGGRVSETTIKAPEKFEGRLRYQLNDPHGQPYDAYPTLEMAQNYRRQAGRGYTIEDLGKAGEKNVEIVHSLDLTPAMRHSALREGQPLFQAAIGATGAGLALKASQQAQPQTDEEALLAAR